MANAKKPTNRQAKSAFGMLMIIVMLSVSFFNVGTQAETAKFFADDNAHAVSVKKTTIDPPKLVAARTEPVTRSENKPTEVAPPVEQKAAVLPATESKSNEQIVWEYLIAQGFSREQTAGIMGNLMQEHRFQTDGDGLAQWTGARKANLLQRSDPYNLIVQLDYLMEELNGNYAAVKGAILATGLEGSVLAFQNRFERCGLCMEGQRIQYAYDILGRH